MWAKRKYKSGHTVDVPCLVAIHFKIKYWVEWISHFRWAMFMIWVENYANGGKTVFRLLMISVVNNWVIYSELGRSWKNSHIGVSVFFLRNFNRERERNTSIILRFDEIVMVGHKIEPKIWQIWGITYQQK